MKAKVALLVAIILGIVAAWGIQKYLSKEKEKVTSKLQERAVVAAGERIKRGEPINLAQLKQKMVPEEVIGRDNIMWGAADRLVREKLNRDVEAGEPILWNYVQQAERQVTTTLPPGELALTLRTDDVSGVAGTLRPGSHVDVYATLPAAKSGQTGATGGQAEVVTRRVLANVTILAIDNRTALQQANLNPYGRGIQPYSTVTVAVTPEETALLIFIQSQGQITLSLRNATDIVAPNDTVAEINASNVLSIADRLDRERKTRQAGSVIGTGE